MTVLALDASTARPTVAVVARVCGVSAELDVAARSEHAEPLLPAILSLLASHSLSLHDVSAIVCGAGPGGFTGLRTAASIAKGLAMGLSVPLHAVPSLDLIVSAIPSPKPGPYLAVLDAGRGDRFAALIEWPRASGAGYVLVPSAEVPAMAAKAGATIVGPETGAWPHARGAVHLDWGPPVDLAAWEPEYGRESAAEDRRRSRALPGIAR